MEEGLTLVEIIFSVAVMSIGLTAVIGVIVQGVHFNQVTRAQQKGNEAAQTRLEDTLEDGANNLDVGSSVEHLYTQWVNQVTRFPANYIWNGYDSSIHTQGGAEFNIRANISNPDSVIYMCAYETEISQSEYNQNSTEEFEYGGFLYALGPGTNSRMAAFPISINPTLYMVFSEVNYPYFYRGGMDPSGGPPGIAKRARAATIQYGGNAAMPPEFLGGDDAGTIAGIIRPMAGYSVDSKLPLNPNP